MSEMLDRIIDMCAEIYHSGQTEMEANAGILNIKGERDYVFDRLDAYFRKINDEDNLKKLYEIYGRELSD